MKRFQELSKGTIVLVHGAFEHAGRYGWLADKWEEAGFNVICKDLPGQGKTIGIKGHIDSFDEYIEAISNWLIEAKAFQKPVFLLGHSMGGLAVIRMLEEKRPDVKGVILSSPGLGLASRPPRWILFFTRMLEKKVPEFQVKLTLHPFMSTRNTHYHQRNKEDPLFLKKVSIRWYHEFERAISQAFQKINRYPEIPTLIMQAGKDLIIQAQEVQQWFKQLPIQNKMYKQWNGLFHEIFNEPERDEVFQYAKAFINEKIE
ncbi:lysophospholipase [Salinibacillus kushneri]|uniref:Lysophospholipase n=1 Tax=Salinibacillus kushneri TaxID=237682 RepID=A0A1H9Y3P8_9BACI|nr:alpha/beta hydrolase [Salinibacillus kushneri]SES63431.1 lysophospholipase [Salinibacillus kushneri]